MLILLTSHPWSLDSGDPCRNDGVVGFYLLLVILAGIAEIQYPGMIGLAIV